MRTETRAKILEIITQQRGTRPIELVMRLGITAQAIHRHLRALVAAGMIEAKGRGPKTRYCRAGVPDLDGARRWFSSVGTPDKNPSEFVCETRDVFAARIGRLGAEARQRVSGPELSLLVSAAGEIGNNCFDHNLGQWRDVPGCWFESQSTGDLLWIAIADRGQGVFRSLARVDPSLKDEQSALLAAFERALSGRAPEQRGNGLKFVRNIVSEGAGRGLACRSGAATIHYGSLGPECRAELARLPGEAGAGTITVLAWRVR